MKNIRLIFNFYSQNKLPALILFVTFTLAILVVTLSLGEYRFITYSQSQFTNLANKELLYCTPLIDYKKVFAAHSGDEMLGNIGQIEKRAAQYNAYEPFSTASYFNIIYNGQNSMGYLYNEQLLATQRVALAQGDWFTQPPQEGCFDVVLSGERYANIKMGEIFKVNILTDEMTEYPIKVRAVGRLDAPNILPSFSTSGTHMTANDLYQSFYGLVFLESDALIKTLAQSKTASTTYSSFMATMNPSATAAEKEEYLTFLTEQGTVTTYDTIMENTTPIVERKLRQTLPIPIFFLSIITIASISLSVLFVHKKFNEYAIYYLCGCSRAKTYVYMLCGIGLVSLLGALLNILLCKLYPLLLSHGVLNFGNVLLDDLSVLYIAAYAGLTILLSASIPFLVFRKHTPIEVYRRFES